MATGLTLTSLVADTPLGPMTVLMSPAGVLATFAGEDASAPEALVHKMGGDLGPERSETLLAGRELDAYFGGHLRCFTTPVDLSATGTGFSRRVLEQTRAIPYGQLRTYGDVAAAAGGPRAARAAGGALARCPIEVFVPCHRVVSAGPSLGSYGGHDERRLFLLRLEGSL